MTAVRHAGYAVGGPGPARSYQRPPTAVYEATDKTDTAVAELVFALFSEQEPLKIQVPM